MNPKTFRLSSAAAAAAGLAVLATSGCMGSSDSSSSSSAATPAPPAAVDDKSVIPASAGASGVALVSYVKSMSADEVATEPNTFAAGFADPPEDGDEPMPAS